MICQVLLFGFLVIIFVSLIVEMFVCVDRISFCWTWNLYSGVLENSMWDISKPDIRICLPHSFVEGRDKGAVGCSDLFASIDCFDWSKISFKFYVKALFCWLLTCVNHIYWIRVHWSINLSTGVLENCQWAVSKPDIRIWFPRRFLVGYDEGAGFCDFTFCHQYIDWLQVNSSS